MSWLMLFFACEGSSPSIGMGVDVDEDTGSGDGDEWVDNTGGEDTCTQGDTFSNLGATYLALTLTVTFDAGTERGADLPEDYYAEVDVDGRSTDGIEDALTRLELNGAGDVVVTFGSEPTPGDLWLRWPDRREFIDCVHPGMEDVYWLRIPLLGAESGLTVGTLEQGVDLGDI